MREPLNVNEANPVSVEETEHAENTEKKVNPIRVAEISITAWAEEADEATKLEDSATTVEKVAVVAKGDAAKAVKTDT